MSPYKAIYYFVTGVLLLILLFNLFTSWRISPVFGNSMQPNYYEGDFILIDENVYVDDLNKGDVVVFNHNCDNIPIIDESVVHRVHTVNENQVLTKGDNNEYIDQRLGCVQSITNNNLIGRVESQFSTRQLIN